MTFPVTAMLPPAEPLLMVSVPINVAQLGAKLVVPSMVMLFAVIVEAPTL